ncbi:TRAP transporter large permease subunit [Salipiger sp. HF18]|nr:TRAP transporter large permease subunit [Salipiger sp. HF18]
MRRFRGGPVYAKISALALLGTVSGSAVANVVGTGVVTIPMIRRRGLDRRADPAADHGRRRAGHGRHRGGGELPRGDLGGAGAGHRLLREPLPRGVLRGRKAGHLRRRGRRADRGPRRAGLDQPVAGLRPHRADRLAAGFGPVARRGLDRRDPDAVPDEPDQPGHPPPSMEADRGAGGAQPRLRPLLRDQPGLHAEPGEPDDLPDALWPRRALQRHPAVEAQRDLRRSVARRGLRHRADRQEPPANLHRHPAGAAPARDAPRPPPRQRRAERGGPQRPYLARRPPRGALVLGGRKPRRPHALLRRRPFRAGHRPRRPPRRPPAAVQRLGAIRADHPRAVHLGRPGQ